MRFEFTRYDVHDFVQLVKFSNKHVPKSAPFRPVRAIVENQIKVMIDKILFYASDTISYSNATDLKKIWLKITGEDYAS